jgi:hypothetical protein
LAHFHTDCQGAVSAARHERHTPILAAVAVAAVAIVKAMAIALVETIAAGKAARTKTASSRTECAAEICRQTC